MPKILFGISSSYCAHFMKGQVGYLVSRGFSVVIISGPGKEIETLCREEGAVLHTIDLTRKLTPLHDLRTLFSIISILRKEKPDVVNAGNPKPGLLLTLACLILGIKARLFTMHGLVSDSRSGWRGSLIRSMEKLTCTMATKVLVVSRSLALHAINIGVLEKNKAVVIGNGSYNGIDLGRFTRHAGILAEAGKMRKDLGISEGQFVFGFAGRITKDKGIDILLPAFKDVQRSYPDVQLIVAGPMDDENPLDRSLLDMLQHDPSIHYLGNLDDIVPFYPAIDVLVLSSYREGFGNVLIEAAAMEVPVIAPRIPGCSDAVSDGFNGQLFTVGDAASLREAMVRYVSDPGLKAKHGAAGRLFVARFNREEIWEGQYGLYLSLMDK